MAEIKKTERASRILNNALECCQSYRHEFIMPEHLLSVLIEDDIFNAALNIFYSPQILAERVEEFLKQIDSVPADLAQLQRQNLFLIKFQSVFAPLSFQLVDYQ